MSSHPAVICVRNIDIDSDLISAAKNECEGLDLNTTAPYKIFQPKEKCNKILDFIKEKQTPRKVRGRSIHVTLPGANTRYLRAPCIAIPIKTKGLPTSLITRGGQNITVDWEGGVAWEILQDVKPAAVHEKGGTLLLLYLES
ncbi:MAG: hypothetical protein Q9214_005899 [Letrouitia sp. 1 TL-2023]